MEQLLKLPGVEVTGTLLPGFETILTPDALEFVAFIERRFRDLVITEVARHLTAHNDTMNTHLQGVLSERQITLLPVSLAETHSEFPSEPEFTPKSPKAT